MQPKAKLLHIVTENFTKLDFEDAIHKLALVTGRAIKIPPIALKTTSLLVITKCPGPLFGLEVSWCSTARILSAAIPTPPGTQLHPKCLLLHLWLMLIPDHAWALPQTLQFVPRWKQSSQFNGLGNYAE